MVTNNQRDKINVTVSVQEKQGMYYAVLQYKDKYNKKQYKWKATKIEAIKGNKRNAERKAEEIRQQLENELNESQTENNTNNLLFGDYLLDWLKKQKSQVELSTYSGYERNVKKTAEYFNNKGITIQELRTKHIQEYYDNLQQTCGIKWNTVKRYHANIHKALEDAITLELIDNNPASHIRHKKVEQYIASYYNENELNELLEKVKGDLLEPIIKVTAYYGLRKEEILGLKFDAVDFENKTITIKHTVTNASVGGKRILVQKDRTKNKTSYRTYPLLKEIEIIFQDLKAKQEQNKNIFGNTYQNKDNYIFTDEQGNLIKPDRVSRRFKQLLKDNNLKPIRFHDLRHSCATLLLAKGKSLEEIQIWLGHSSRLTTEIYANNEVLDKTSTAETISKALNKST